MRLLRYSADQRTLIVVGSWFALQATAWCWKDARPLVIAPIVVLLCAGAFLCATAAHNAVHCPVFRSRTLERAWRVLLTLGYGHPISAYVPVHNLSHHRHLETERDVMRLSKARSRWHLANLFLFAPSIGGQLLRAEVDYARHAWRRRPRWRTQLVLEGVVLALVMGALAVIDWRRLVVFVLLPHAYAAWGIVTMNILQHDGAAAASSHDHSRNFTGRVVNWLTFNNGYHTIHHLRPGAHWSRARIAHERLVAPFIDPRLVEASLAAYVVRTFVFPGRRRRFDGTPLVPSPVGRDRPWY